MFNRISRPDTDTTLNFHLDGRFTHPTHAIVEQCDICTNPGMKYCKVCKMRFCFKCKYDINPHSKKSNWDAHKIICDENIHERFKKLNKYKAISKEEVIKTYRCEFIDDNKISIRSKHVPNKCIFCATLGCQTMNNDHILCDFCVHLYCNISYAPSTQCKEICNTFIFKYNLWRFYANSTINYDISTYIINILLIIEDICVEHSIQKHH